MLEFNVGELTSRLRRALGVRGRMPLGLDEHVIPVALTADVSVPPWRTNPVFATGGESAVYSNSTSGNRPLVRLEYPAGAAGGTQSVFIVTGWLAQPIAFVTATGAALSTNAVYAVFKPDGPTAGDVGGTTRKLITTERAAAPASLVPYQLPVTLKATQNSNSPPPGGAAGQVYYARQGVVQPASFYPVQIALRPGQCIEFWQETDITVAANSEGLSVSVQGLFYGLGG